MTVLKDMHGCTDRPVRGPSWNGQATLPAGQGSACQGRLLRVRRYLFVGPALQHTSTSATSWIKAEEGYLGRVPPFPTRRKSSSLIVDFQPGSKQRILTLFRTQAIFPSGVANSIIGPRPPDFFHLCRPSSTVWKSSADHPCAHTYTTLVFNFATLSRIGNYFRVAYFLSCQASPQHSSRITTVSVHPTLINHHTFHLHPPLLTTL